MSENHSAQETPATVPAPTLVCAWCPNFDPNAASNHGASHGICQACAARLESQVPR
jgi:hypothetical protein